MAEKFAFLFMLFGCICQIIVGEKEDYCYADDANPYRYFSTKTAYEIVGAVNMRILNSECKPKYVWALIRHGTRFTTSAGDGEILRKLRDDILVNVDGNGKRGNLCSKDIEELKKWTYKGPDDDMIGRLTTQGKKDIVSLVKRLKTNLNSLLNARSNIKDRFLFLTSSKSRCKSSSIIFTNELLGTSFENLEGNNIKLNDQLLRIMDNAEKIDISEKDKFLKSNYMKQLITDVSERLGFEQPLPLESIQKLYASCAYENAWEPLSKPPFCAAFTRYQLQVLEYLEDLERYYSLGYGNPNNAKYACPILKDLDTKLSEAAKQDTAQSTIGALYFTHSETIIPLLTKLGLCKDDEPLKSDNFERMKDSRKWKLSTLDPFNSNLIVVLYKCSDDDKVMFYNNENVIKFPECDEMGVCKLAVLQEKFKKELSERACKIGSSNDNSDDFVNDNVKKPTKDEENKDETKSTNSKDEKIVKQKDDKITKPTIPLDEKSSANGFIYYSNNYILVLSLVSYICNLLL